MDTKFLLKVQVNVEGKIEQDLGVALSLGFQATALQVLKLAEERLNRNEKMGQEGVWKMLSLSTVDGFKVDPEDIIANVFHTGDTACAVAEFQQKMTVTLPTESLRQMNRYLVLVQENVFQDQVLEKLVKSGTLGDLFEAPQVLSTIVIEMIQNPDRCVERVVDLLLKSINDSNGNVFRASKMASRIIIEIMMVLLKYVCFKRKNEADLMSKTIRLTRETQALLSPDCSLYAELVQHGKLMRQILKIAENREDEGAFELVTDLLAEKLGIDTEQTVSSSHAEDIAHLLQQYFQRTDDSKAMMKNASSFRFVARSLDILLNSYDKLNELMNMIPDIIQQTQSFSKRIEQQMKNGEMPLERDAALFSIFFRFIAAVQGDKQTLDDLQKEELKKILVHIATIHNRARVIEEASEGESNNVCRTILHAFKQALPLIHLSSETMTTIRSAKELDYLWALSQCSPVDAIQVLANNPDNAVDHYLGTQERAFEVVKALVNWLQESTEEAEESDIETFNTHARLLTWLVRLASTEQGVRLQLHNVGIVEVLMTVLYDCQDHLEDRQCDPMIQRLAGTKAKLAGRCLVAISNAQGKKERQRICMMVRQLSGLRNLSVVVDMYLSALEKPFERGGNTTSDVKMRSIGVITQEKSKAMTTSRQQKNLAGKY